MNNQCFYDGLTKTAEWANSFEQDEIGGLFVAIFLCSILCALIVLRFYQRRVELLMQSSSKSTQDADADDPTPHDLPENPDFSSLHSALSAETVQLAAKQHYRSLLRALTISAGAFVILTGMVLTLSPDTPGELQRRTLTDWLSAGAVALVFAATLSAPILFLGISHARFAKLFWWVFVPAIIIFAVAEVLFENHSSRSDQLEILAAAPIIIAGLYLAIGNRSLRNVVPLLVVLGCLLVLSLYFINLAVGVVEPCLNAETIPGGLAALGISIGALWLVWRLSMSGLGWLIQAYERKRFSDAQFQIGTWMIFVTLLLGLGAGPADGGLSVGTLGIVAALAAGVWLYCAKLKRIEAWQSPQRLLLLRVFAHDNRGERLLDEIAFHWRFIGPIHMISGPDVAKANLDPHELFLFLRRRLVALFVTNRATLMRRMTAVDEKPDPDGRYRINEFFCFDGVWQEAVDRLVGMCQAVLLDLRGFKETRRGTAFEIALLARRDALKRTVVLVDAETDLQAIDRTVAQVPGARISQARMVRLGRGVLGDEIFRALVERASA